MALAESSVGVVIDPPVEEVKSWQAILSDDGTLLGFDKTGKIDSVEVPVDCDLTPGKYRWVAADARFEPIADAIVKQPPGPEPDQVVAVALAIRAIGKTIALPTYTQKWLEQFVNYPDDWSR